MPQPQVPDDYAPLLDHRLARAPGLPPLFQKTLLDASTGAVSVLAFLVGDGGVAVRAEPDLCGSILGRHGHERDVDDQCEGDGGVVEVGVIVRGLRRWG